MANGLVGSGFKGGFAGLVIDPSPTLIGPGTNLL
jgi:hypothetical protein